MSETKVFAVTKDTVVRRHDGVNQGCGKSKHIYVGRHSGDDYDYYVEFDLNWTDVAKIRSATLNVYTDEYNTFGSAGTPGIMPAPASDDRPKVTARRLTSNFVEGNNEDGHFNASDFTAPTKTVSGEAPKTMTPVGANLLHSIDVTAIVRAWAPSKVQGGGRHDNHGIGLYGTTDPERRWSGWSSEHATAGQRPSITLVYDLGPTVPNTPGTNIPLSPVGAIPSLDTFEGGFSDRRSTDTLQSTVVQVFDGGHSGTADTDNFIYDTGHGLVVNDAVYFTAVGDSNLVAFKRYFVVSSGFTKDRFRISATSGGSVFNITEGAPVTWSKLVKAINKTASNSERVAATSIVERPSDLVLSAGPTYRWRMQQTDQEGQVSPWSGLVSISLTNTPPNAPTLSPATGTSLANLNLQKFEGGTFTDPNAGDHLMAHQVQLSPFPPSDIGWDEADGILWDTGKVYDSFDATSWVEYYGGRALDAGTYYWRARQWDHRDGASSWSYATIVLSESFSPDPGSYDNVQVNPNAPWRILIRNLYQADGVTKTVGRGPGQLVAVFEEAKSVGASVVFNSPGEMHFTLLKDDPQISVVEPKQTHYAVEFYSGDGWQEKYAGVVWDVDATDTDLVFKCIDYLALYDTVIDERYDPLKPNKSYKNNGSFYSNVAIRTVVLDQLNRAKKMADSWVGFISIGTVATMNEKTTVYSTMQPTLSFVAGLIDSHRQGTGKRTRIKVVKTTSGGYQLQIVDDPGVIRSDLAMYYGELVQGYRLIIFGENWANVEHVVGRNRDGVKVVYQTIKDKPFQPSQSLFGRIATVAVMDGVQDQLDLNRRGLQAAIQSAKLGKHIAIGIRTKYLAPLQGWDVCDVFPLAIKDGPIDTDALGSGLWAAYAAAWEATDIGQQSLIITFMPREDATAPDPDLIGTVPISDQSEWQLGWTPPDPVTAVSDVWLDQVTGQVWVRDEETGTLVPVTGTA